MKKKILVIDDDAYLGMHMKEFLEEQGFSAECATDGPEGLDVIENFQPHLILLDLIKPRSDGFEALQEIRRNFPNIPIVVLSGKSIPLTTVLDHHILPTLQPTG